MTEQWRAVVGFEGYEVSDHGRVRSLDRMLPWKRTLRTGTVVDCFRRHAGHTLTPQAKDPANNNLGNLRWGTRADNFADFVRNHGRTPGVQFPEQRRP